jgi:flagellar hook assembly protein FlgD
LSHPVNVKLAVYNLSGQQVALLDQGARQAGTYTVRWNGLDQAGRSMASGLYVYRLRAGPQTQTRKLLMIK